MKRKSGLSSERGATLINPAMTCSCRFGSGHSSSTTARSGSAGVRHNTADAGAMAGALARAFDDFDRNPAGLGRPGLSKRVAGRRSEPAAGCGRGAVLSDMSGRFHGPDRCVRVDVSLDETDYQELLKPKFGRALLLSSQSVQATATAEFSSRMRPIACGRGPFRTSGRKGPCPPIRVSETTTTRPARCSGGPVAGPQPPNSFTPGTGFRFATGNAPSPAPEAGDFGFDLPLTFSTNPTAVTDRIVPGWLVALNLPGGSAACNGQLIEVGDRVALSPANPSTADFTQLLSRIRPPPGMRPAGRLAAAVLPPAGRSARAWSPSPCSTRDCSSIDGR